MAIPSITTCHDVLMKRISANRIQSTCLTLIAEVFLKREPLLITKRGKPMAKLVPAGAEPDFVGRSKAWSGLWATSNRRLSRLRPGKLVVVLLDTHVRRLGSATKTSGRSRLLKTVR